MGRYMWFLFFAFILPTICYKLVSAYPEPSSEEGNSAVQVEGKDHEAEHKESSDGDVPIGGGDDSHLQTSRDIGVGGGEGANASDEGDVSITMRSPRLTRTDAFKKPDEDDEQNKEDTVVKPALTRQEAFKNPSFDAEGNTKESTGVKKKSRLIPKWLDNLNILNSKPEKIPATKPLKTQNAFKNPNPDQDKNVTPDVQGSDSPRKTLTRQQAFVNPKFDKNGKIVEHVTGQKVEDSKKESSGGWTSWLNPTNWGKGDKKAEVPAENKIAIGGGGRTQESSNPGVFTDVEGAKHFTKGKYYELDYDTYEDFKKPMDLIIIKGKKGTDTETIQDVFQPHSEEHTKRTLYYSDDTVLVGGLYQNFLVYGQAGFTRRLLVMQDGKCSVNNYIAKDLFVKVVDANLCKQMKEAINNLQTEFSSAPSVRKQDVVKENQDKLNDLVKLVGIGEKAVKPSMKKLPKSDLPPQGVVEKMKATLANILSPSKALEAVTKVFANVKDFFMTPIDALAAFWKIFH